MLTGTSTQNFSYFLNVTTDYFCSKHSAAPLFWAGFSFVCILLGFPATVKVLLELSRRHRQNISNDFFVFNLTFIDLAYLSILPFSVFNYIVWHNIQFEWLCNFMYSLTVSGRPLFMACVCGDYYFAVVHPIIYMTNKRSAMIRKIISVIVWLFIIIFGSLVASNTIYFTILGCTPMFISLPVIGFCDVSVFRALRKTSPSGKSNLHPQKKRALRTIINSFIMTFIVYLPPSIIFSLGHTNNLIYEVQYCILLFVAVCFTISGCVIMPVLYLGSTGQHSLRKILK
ncbi:lysophosphatidic acid receptor 4-like [Puntigrus tetrazona]|uniref:lysophosphatidic acid receptor 4-like n=1 Tax=Puntigrus tetrazona TaxID=1606681 RepID=UPI001C89816B|nr:lysophosphatidic acid receptor 4-like [Puntigrus tetrazona]